MTVPDSMKPGTYWLHPTQSVAWKRVLGRGCDSWVRL